MVRIFVGFELKWAQQFARLLGVAGRRHLRLPSLSGPASGPAWLALRPPIPPAPGAAALLCARRAHLPPALGVVALLGVRRPCPPADAAPPPTPTSSPAAPRRRRRASPTVVRPAPPRCAPPRCLLLSQQVVSLWFSQFYLFYCLRTKYTNLEN